MLLLLPPGLGRFRGWRRWERFFVLTGLSVLPADTLRVNLSSKNRAQLAPGTRGRGSTGRVRVSDGSRKTRLWRAFRCKQTVRG